jgi:CheY-like chemotaxis protein
MIRMPAESCPKCVLLVEDDDALRERISAFLESRGYPTVASDSAERAVDLLLHGNLARPCLVLADFLTLRVDWGKFIGALEPDDQLATLPMALVSMKRTGLPFHRIKRPLDLDLLARVVEGHCCAGEGQGGRTPANHEPKGAGER